MKVSNSASWIDVQSHIFIIKDGQNMNSIKASRQKTFINEPEEVKTSYTTVTSNTIENVQSENSQSDDLYLCLRPVFILGRIIGLIPISGILHTNIQTQNIQFKWKSFPVLVSITACLLLGVSSVLSCLHLFHQFAGSGGGNASEMALAAGSPLFYLMGTTLYVFFLLRSSRLIRLFTTWKRISTELDFEVKDAELYTHSNYTAAIIFTSAVFENMLDHFKTFPVLPRSDIEEETERNFTNFETYYWRSHSSWAEFIPYNPVLTILLLLTDKLATYAINYTDILIIICSRALYFKFKVLIHQTEKQLLTNEQNSDSIIQKLNGRSSWAQVRTDHLTLCKLLDELEEILSPLIFMSYSINIYFVCLQLHEGLTPSGDRNFLESISSAWAFVHLIGRVLTVSLTAAKVNDYAHQITNCLQKCTTAEYCKELERLERMLGTGPIGLSGLGCFVITRAFMLMVVSVIFTFEIVLLQASASGIPFSSTPAPTPISINDG